MKLNKGVMLVVFTGLVLGLISGCSGGGGSNTAKDTPATPDAPVADTFIDWELNSTPVSARVELPSGSPLGINETNVDVVYNTYSADSNGEVDIKVPAGQITDTFVMLQNPQTNEYVVYLLASVLPGENNVVYSAEETAVSLVLNGINHIYLTETDSPETVKYIIRKNSAEFINEFVPALTADPYLLRGDNLSKVYSAVFHEAVKASEAELKILYESQNVSAKASKKSVGSSRFAVGGKIENYQGLSVAPDYEIQDFLIRPDRGFSDTGVMTGDIIIENDTMLPAKAKAVTLVPTKVATANPKAEIFGDIVSPQLSPILGSYARSTAIRGTKFRTHEVTLYTPGWKIYSKENSDYTEVMAMNRALNQRLLLDNAIKIVSTFAPVDDENVKIKIMQWIVQQGFFQTGVDYIYESLNNNPESAKFETAFYNVWYGLLNTDNLKVVVNIIAERYSDSPITLAKETAKILFKVTTIEAQVWIYGADLLFTEADLFATDPVIKFTQVSFPLYFKNYGPSALKKVATEDDVRRVELFGDGLNTFTALGGTYVPAITLEAKDVNDEIQIYPLIEADIHSDAVDSIWFNLPYEWVKVGSDIVGPIYFQIEHGFQDPYKLDAITGIKIPDSAELKDYYQIGLSSDLIITSISKNKVEHGEEEIYIFGEGFAEFMADNHVIFTDYEGNSVSISVDLRVDNYLQISIPEDIDFGSYAVRVELPDGEASNEISISVMPKTPRISPDPYSTDFDNTLEVTLTQSEGAEIWYSIDSGAEIKYTAPITLTQTSTVYAFAKALINDVEYRSAVGSYSYHKCLNTETLDPDTNMCVVANDPVDPGVRGFEFTKSWIFNHIAEAKFEVSVTANVYNAINPIISVEDFANTDAGKNIELSNMKRDEVVTVSGKFTVNYPSSATHVWANGDTDTWAFSNPRIERYDTASDTLLDGNSGMSFEWIINADRSDKFYDKNSVYLVFDVHFESSRLNDEGGYDLDRSSDYSDKLFHMKISSERDVPDYGTP